MGPPSRLVHAARSTPAFQQKRRPPIPRQKQGLQQKPNTFVKVGAVLAGYTPWVAAAVAGARGCLCTPASGRCTLLAARRSGCPAAGRAVGGPAGIRGFLADASFVLTGSLDYETTLESVACLVVPEYADWCGVGLVEADGKLRQVAVAHTDPSKVEWARALRSQYPTDLTAPAGVPEVIRSGRSALYPAVTDEMLRSVAVDDEHYRIVKDLGMRSVIVAPLVARGRALGALTFARTEGGRPYR